MIWTHMAAAVVAGALAFGGAWRVQDWRFGAKEKERLEQEAELRRMNAKRVDTAAVNHENFKERERVVYQTITETVDRIVERPVYRNVCLDDDGVRALNAAIRGAADPGIPAPDVPAAR